MLQALCWPAPSAAQDDYLLFRTNVQYLYRFPEALAESDSPIVGMKLSADSCAQTYMSLRMADAAHGNASGCIPIMPSFAGARVCQEEGAIRLSLQSDSIFIIQHRLPLGHSWQAGRCPTTGALIWGRVEAVQEDTFLGLTDSVKYIVFYRLDANGQVQYLPAPNRPLRISKHHGLVGGPWLRDLCEYDHSLELLGMSQPAAGLQNPVLEDFFDLAPGDELHTEEQGVQGSRLRHVHSILKLQTATFHTGGYAVRMQFKRQRMQFFSSWWGDSFQDTTYFSESDFVQEFTASSLAFLNAQPGSIFPDSSYGNSAISVVMLGAFGTCGAYQKFLSAPFWMSTPQCVSMLTDAAQGGSFVTSLAGPYIDIITLGGPVVRRLRFYRKGSLTCGAPFTFPTAVQEPTLSGLSAYPNPFDQSLELTVPAKAVVRLYDLTGRLLGSFRCPEGHCTLALPEHLPAGIYMIQVQTAQGRGVLRAMKG